MRFMMRRLGVLEPNGARVLSYLLFERGYCRHLMHMGFADAMAKRAEILAFLPGAAADLADETARCG
jgi:NTE family protein